MDIHQLELFLAVMDSPSMTRAAEKIHLSPGAVSLQLHNLAGELHTELFVRRGKRLLESFPRVRSVVLRGIRVAQRRLDAPELRAPGVFRVFGALPGLTGIAFLVAAVWMLIAAVIAVRQAFDYTSTVRAASVCVPGWLVYVFPLFFLLLLLG